MSELIKYCKCGVQIPEARLKILPNTHTCVNCSDVQTKKPVIVQRGKGDHTYTETVIMEHDDYVKYQQMEAVFTGVPFEDVNDEEEVIVKEEFEEVPIEGEIKDLSNYFKLEEE